MREATTIQGGQAAYRAGLGAGRACRKAESRASSGLANPYPAGEPQYHLWACGHYDGYWGVEADYEIACQQAAKFHSELNR